MAQLYSRLAQQGHTVWWDIERMPSRGQTFLHEIREAIAASKKVIVIVGPAANASDYVRSEWQYALSLSKPVTPLLRQGSYDDVPAELRLFHTPDVRVADVPASVWAEIDRVLSEPLRPLAELRDVPAIPPNYQAQAGAVTELCAQLHRDQTSLNAADTDERVVAVTGMPGSGKTVLASALARLTPVRRTYEHIFWIACGPRFDRTAAEERLSQLRAQVAGTTDSQEFVQAFESAAILVVLDDLWSLESLEPFLNELGSRSRVLFTTREAWIADSLASLRFTTLPFASDTALRFLANWVDADVHVLPPAAHTIAEYCENLPLALAMVGALAKSGVAWSDILVKLRAADLQFVAARLRNYPYRSLAATLQVSFDTIRKEDADAAAVLADLAVFEGDAPISKFAIEVYASHRHGLSPVDVRRVLVFLGSRSVLVVDEASVTIHALVRAYISAGLITSPDSHRQLVSSFETLCAGTGDGMVDWCTLPRDEYIRRHLVQHLIWAERVPEAERVLADGRWPIQQIEQVGVTELLRDYREYTSAADTPSATITCFARALARAAHILRRDPSQYRLQMHMRLGGDTVLAKQFAISRSDLPAGTPRPTNPQSDAAADGLIAQCSERLGSVLCGEFTSIEGRLACVTGDSRGTVIAVDVASGEVIYRLEAHSDHIRALAVLPEKSLLATGSGEWLDVHNDCSIKLWNQDAGDYLATLSACDYFTPHDEHSHRQPIGDLQFSPDGTALISASWDGTIGIWNVATRQHIRTLRGHRQGLNTATVTAAQEFIVSGSADGAITVWDYASGKMRRMLDYHAGAPLRIRPVPQSTLVACITDHGVLLVLNVASGRLHYKTTVDSSHITGMLVMSSAVVRLSTSDGQVLDIDLNSGSTTVVQVLEQTVDAGQFFGTRHLALSRGSLTSFYDLSLARPHSTPDGLEFGAVSAAASGLRDVACVVGRAGVVSAYSISPVRRLARRTADDLILYVEDTPDGVLTRAKDCFTWWSFSGGEESDTPTVSIDINRQEVAPDPEPGSFERLSRSLLLMWREDAWAAGTVYRFNDAATLWTGLIGRPRELQVFFSHELDAPSIAGSYYALAAVDYDHDRFGLYVNSRAGILLFRSFGSSADGIAIDARLEDLPYGRRADFVSFVPGTDYYVEGSGSRLRLWDLDTEELVAEVQSDVIEHGRMDSSTCRLTTIGRGGVVRQYDARTLRVTCEAAITALGAHPRVLSVAPCGLIAVTDHSNSLHVIDSRDGRVFCPVGFDSRLVGCIFSEDGHSALVVERRGLLSGFDLR